VSPRTVFRYFVTHVQLAFETVTDMFDACGRRVELRFTKDEFRTMLDEWIMA